MMVVMEMLLEPAMERYPVRLFQKVRQGLDRKDLRGHRQWSTQNTYSFPAWWKSSYHMLKTPDVLTLKLHITRVRLQAKLRFLYIIQPSRATLGYREIEKRTINCFIYGLNTIDHFDN